jgi:hypothetical protein
LNVLRTRHTACSAVHCWALQLLPAQASAAAVAQHTLLLQHVCHILIELRLFG